MYAIYDPYWISIVVPNLPREYWKEYVELLADFAPVPLLKNGCFSRSYKGDWVFPFIAVSVEDFSYEKFDDYTVFVEELMCEVYGLTEDHFADY